MLINTLINNNKTEFNNFFYKLIKSNLDKSILSKAMIYGSFNGGKRIRPFLVNQAAKIAKAKKWNIYVYQLQLNVFIRTH